MTTKFEREVEVAKDLARQAGAILLEVRETKFQVDYKIGDDPVTEADRRANECIVAGLRKAFAQDGVVAEETADQSDALKFERCWFVDPLDGTREFVAGRTDFSVMIGLAIGGRATVGVVFQPLEDKLYAGVVGGGAVLEVKGESRALKVSAISEANKLRLISSRSHRSKSVDAVKTKLGISQEDVSGSVGLKVGFLVEDKSDVYVHLSDKSAVWDTCGPEAILIAAGGRFTDMSGQAYDYRRSDVYNRKGILATNAAAYDQVLKAVHEVAAERGFTL